MERTKVKDPGIKIRMEKVGTLTNGIKAIGISKGKGKGKGGKSKYGDKRVAAVENSEAEGSNQAPQQPEPEITALFALEEMADRGSRRSERPGRSPSVRSAVVRHQAEETIEEMKKRLEKIQHEMNRSGC